VPCSDMNYVKLDERNNVYIANANILLGERARVLFIY
jgi:hypothetical protein